MKLKTAILLVESGLRASSLDSFCVFVWGSSCVQGIHCCFTVHIMFEWTMGGLLDHWVSMVIVFFSQLLFTLRVVTHYKLHILLFSSTHRRSAGWNSGTGNSISLSLCILNRWLRVSCLRSITLCQSFKNFAIKLSPCVYNDITNHETT